MQNSFPISLNRRIDTNLREHRNISPNLFQIYVKSNEYPSNRAVTTSPGPGFRGAWTDSWDSGRQIWQLQIPSPWLNYTLYRYSCPPGVSLDFRSGSQHARLFAVGGAFVTLSANIIISFTPPGSTGVVSATYSTMRIIGGAIGPIISGMFLALFTSEVQSPEGVTSSVPNTMAFNAIFLVGAIISPSLVAMMFIMKRRAYKMGMPTNK